MLKTQKSIEQKKNGRLKWVVLRRPGADLNLDLGFSLEIVLML